MKSCGSRLILLWLSYVGKKVLKVEKYDYTLHPDAKKLTPRKASEHIPEWRKNGSSEETDYRHSPHSNLPKGNAVHLLRQ